jgi:hypothetical protein
MTNQFKMPAEVMVWSRQDDLLVEIAQNQRKKENRQANLFGMILFTGTIFFYWINR